MLSVQTREFAGYADAIRISNETTELVLCPACGGRVLSFVSKGCELIHLDRRHNGLTLETGACKADLSGGRADVGPEQQQPPHALLFAGPWKAVQSAGGAVRLTSLPDPATGLQLTREFTLSPEGAGVSFVQTMKNVSERTVRACHWGRTLVRSGGVVVVPRSPESRYEQGYVRFEKRGILNFAPVDSAVEVREDFIIVKRPPKWPKLGFDTLCDWIAYVLPSGLAFVKVYPVFPQRYYGDTAAMTLSIYYARRFACELEPIGPLETLGPSASASFFEDWHGVEIPLSCANPVDCGAVAEIVRGLKGLRDPSKDEGCASGGAST